MPRHLTVALLTFSLAACSTGPEPPPDLGSIGTFTFRDQQGTKVAQGDLEGRPMVMNFIFSRCPDRCPVFTARFANLQRKLASHGNLQFVSVTVDPAHDTPDVLAAYARRYDADPNRWQFLTGPLEGLSRAVLDAFLQYLDGRDVQGDPDLMEIVHGELFLLVDERGHIRGFFGSDDASMTRLERALEALRKT